MADRRTSLLLACALSVASGAALAETCSSAVDRMRSLYNVGSAPAGDRSAARATTEAAPPATTESRGITQTQRLAPVGGAFTPPPPAGAGSTPPIGSGSSVPPPQPPAAGAAPASPAASPNLGAAERGRMEALLTAAQDAEQRGDTAHCLELLHEAERIPAEPDARGRK